MPRLSDLQELISNVEKVRCSKYSEIPREIMEKIIKAEYEQLDSRTEGMRIVSEVVSGHLTSNN